MKEFEFGSVEYTSPHLLADLVELSVVLRLSGRSEIHKNDFISLLDSGYIATDEIDQNEFECEDMPYAERIDSKEQKLEDTWAQLEYRSECLQEKYPFQVKDDWVSLICSNLTSIQRIYVFLLAASRLKSFKTKGMVQRWARLFTFVSKIALSAMFPAYAETRIFDANSSDRGIYYGHRLPDALKKLGQDLAVLNTNEEVLKELPTSGDAGVDLVAILDFKDKLCTNYAALAQCGAQQGWPTKTLEASAIRLSSFFQLTQSFPAMMFIPFFYRTASGEWVRTQPTTGVTLLDRYRILFLIEKASLEEKVTDSIQFVDFEKDFHQFISD